MARDKASDDLKKPEFTRGKAPPSVNAPPPRDISPLISDSGTLDIGKASTMEPYGSGGYGSRAFGGNRQTYRQPPFAGGPANKVLNSGRPGPEPFPGVISNTTFDVVEPVKQSETIPPPPPPHFGPEPQLRVGGGVSAKGEAGNIGVVAEGGTADSVTGRNRDEAKHYVLKADSGTYGVNSQPNASRPPINAAVDAQLGEFTSTTDVAVKSRPKRKRVIAIRNKAQVIREASLLIAVLEDALGYQARDRGNSIPPELWRQLNLNNPEAFALVTQLVDELKKLNSFLATERSKGNNEKIVADLKKVGLKVLGTYGSVVAVGAGMLTIGAFCTLLQHVGLGEVVDNAMIWKQFSHSGARPSR